jgi:IS605 OrfB family transposase
MKRRYRYRIEPTSAQQARLAQVFGCCRVVFNDAVRIRSEAYQTGINLSDSEIQRRVITYAKTTGERAWLCEVPSVALVQAVNDSHRAWRNYFDSCTGKRKGRQMGHPRMKSKKDHRQSFRLSRSGFSARRDYHHNQALALVRENQVIHVEDLNVASMVRNRRVARAISDAGWGQFIQIITEKADMFGRTVRPVSRWLASSKTCSACQHQLHALPLGVRQWTCPACRVVHDRDYNAAKVILAAGRAERLNASRESGRHHRRGSGGAPVRPPTRRRGVDEAGSTPPAA